jgi:SWI/SNF-related matrix-associated actin-dependent regulator of chromatin subfamily A member 5
MAMYRVPLQQLKLNYTVSTTNKKIYTEEEDRFLLVMLNKHGLDSEGLYEKIRDEIRESPLFRFDWFFLSRTPQEIGRRCATLITTVTREMEGDKPGGGNKENNGKRAPEEEEEDEDEKDGPAKKKGRVSVGAAKVSS